MLQDNALSSWRALSPSVQVIVFGAETGVADAANGVGALHVPEIATSEHGTPLVSDLFRRAQELATNEMLCFVNADIILPPKLLDAVETTVTIRPDAIGVGQCRDIEIDGDVRGWTPDLEAAARAAPLRGPGGIDYIVFARGAFPTMPPFAVGRANFDNWLLWDARKRGLAVVDFTEAVPAIHQMHAYGHLEGGQTEAYFGAEARRNFALAGGRLRLFNVDDATHRLTPNGLRRNLRAPVRANPAVRRLALEFGRLRRRLGKKESSL